MRSSHLLEPIRETSESYRSLSRCPVRPNPSFKPTRYGRQRKPGLRYSVHSLSPGLRCLPTLAA
jgi:hypothetical protein